MAIGPFFARTCLRLAALIVVAPVGAATQTAAGDAQTVTAAVPEASVYHLFLGDGTSITTLGEFARVGDRVVFTLPLSSTREVLSSLPASSVDWERTNRHTEAVRAARYAATRGETDFAAMSASVARTLTDIAITPGPAAQLELAERARRTLAEWPPRHFDYRADEVRQTLSLLDEVIAGLRATLGRTSFDVSFVANTGPPPTEPVRPRPTLQQSIEQALRLSGLAASAAERTAVLRSVESALDEAEASLPAAWLSATRAKARTSLELERKVDRAYTALASGALRTVERSARGGNVRAIVRARARVLDRDRSLGNQRPGEMQALLAAIDERLDAARRLRLARDRFAARLLVLREFRQTVRPFVDVLSRGRQVLGDIRALAGPPADRLTGFIVSVEGHGDVLRRMRVPDEGRAAQTSLASALQLAETAGRYRQRAIAGNDMRLAWDASAAAAGALLFLERTQIELARMLQRP